ncbi:uncharacterized protein SCDLUD_004056 [Saccharomycodes ludwigii]|uniref:uncharacterized protein n=1 Tax=Saccharomycodes ludwigii TaxID=36035 RepID=UPI001E8C49B2|nr:hypothetical protein SCDLUD_004056 [Saccharomycodes ludwigii]KAH3899768.1 hypothetical protein SCDLUD_004056 [Saccharomycodes ludwigii]
MNDGPSFKIKFRKKNNKNIKKKSLRIKKNIRNNPNPNFGVFASKCLPDKIPDPPKDLLIFLNQLILKNEDSSCSQKVGYGTNVLSNISKTIRIPENETPISTPTNINVCKKTVLNGFMACRAYYSKFIKGREAQKTVTKIISDYWGNNPNIHLTWETFVDIYKKENSGIDFCCWLNKKYTKNNGNLLIVENPENRENYNNIKKPSSIYLENTFFEGLKINLNSCEMNTTDNVLSSLDMTYGSDALTDTRLLTFYDSDINDTFFSKFVKSANYYNLKKRDILDDQYSNGAGNETNFQQK